MSDKLIDEAVKFLGSKSTSNPFQTAKENLAELKQSTVSNYLKKAIPDHDMLNVARRNTTGDEQKELARKEAQRKQGISKAVTRLDKNEEVVLEMDKSQSSSSRGAEGLPLGKKADPVKTDKVKSDALKALQKQYKKVNEASYNDDDHYAIHPDTGKVMDSWSKRDSRVHAVMTQQHKDKGHIIKTGRELNYDQYARK